MENKVIQVFFLVTVLALLPPRIATAESAIGAPIAVSPSMATLLPDNKRPIKHLLLHFADYDIIPTLYGVLTHLRDNQKISLATTQGERAQILKALISGWQIPKVERIEIIGIPKEFDFWVRDQFVVGEKNTFILPERFPRKKMPLSLREILRTNPGKVIHSALKFDGGNVVVDQDSVFVGYNLILENLGPNFPSPDLLIPYIAQLFGKRVVVVGGPDAPLPHPHIDMLMTPVDSDKPTVLVGSPQLATSLLRKDPALNQPYGRTYFDEKRINLPKEAKRLLFSNHDFMERMKGDLSEKQDQEITLAALLAKNLLPETIKAYDLIAEQLQAAGYRVLRLPLLTNHEVTRSPFITYNNMLLETTPTGKRVYMASYNIPSLDREAHDILKALGYEVNPVDVQNIAFYDGTLRCVTQVLKRE